MIVAGLVALLLWASSQHTSFEWITVFYCALFVLALGYAAVASNIYTHGASLGPCPWYSQVLAAPLLALAFLGASRCRRLGGVVAAFLVVLFGYVSVATYAAKLIPLYGGYEGRTSLGAVIELYTHHLGRLVTSLDAVTLAPATVVLELAGITALSAIVLLTVLTLGVLSIERHPRDQRRLPAA